MVPAAGAAQSPSHDLCLSLPTTSMAQEEKPELPALRQKTGLPVLKANMMVLDNIIWSKGEVVIFMEQFC